MAFAMMAIRARSHAVPFLVSLVAVSQIGAAPADMPSRLERFALQAIRSGQPVAPLQDPTDVLDLLAGDPVVRAIQAEAAAARLRGVPSSPANVVDDPRAETDPFITAKVRSALAILAVPSVEAPRTTRFNFSRLVGARPSAPRATKRADAPAAHVQAAIAAASQKTGASYSYLWRAASRESGFDPHADASTSTAYGLFQFLEQTWLLTVKRHGAKHGLGRYAAQIRVGRDGQAYLPSAVDQAVLLALRGDAATSAVLAGEFTQDNRRQLRAALRREPSQGELYVAHFLGPGGAIELLSAVRTNPTRSAAGMFPLPASKNRAIFYERGRPRTVSAVAALLIRKGEQA